MFEKMISRRGKKGFTLIELLVVVSIIGVLMAMGVSAFTNAQRNGRNARRKNDMKAVQNAFEQYYANNGNVYSTSATTMATGYLPGSVMPVDPQGSAYLTPTLTTTAYCVCAVMENFGGNSSNGTCGYDTTPADNTHFCVSQLQ